MAGRARPFVLLTLAAVALATSCRQVAGVHDRDPPAACGELPVGGESCSACAEQSCCGEESACKSDAVCSGIYACLSACPPGDGGCARGCASESSQATASLDACLASSCAQPCGSSCGGLGQRLFPALSTRSADCGACMQQNCCPQATACGTQVSCSTLAGCSEACAPYDMACNQRCSRDHADGSVGFEDVKACVEANCGEECLVGTFWSCVGSVKAPKARRAGTARIDVTLTAVPSGKSTEGAEIKACSRLDFACASPISTTKTDAQGRAKLEVPLLADAAFEGYLHVAHKDFLPQLVLLSPAIVDDLTLPPVPVVEPSTLDSFAGVLKAKIDPERGHVLAFALDCGNAFAGGVSFELTGGDAATGRLYLIPGPLPAPNAKVTSAGAFGLVGFLNVPPGPVSLTYRLASAPATDPPLGTVSVDIVKGTLSQVLAPPRPSSP